jgi:hypothetical protein
MTPPGIKGLPTVEPGCGVIEVVVLVGDVVLACTVVPADLQPPTVIAHISSAANIRKNRIFIVIS